MKNKQVKKLRSYTEKYKVVLGVLIMVGALLAASSINLQTGFIAADSGFEVPYPDGEVVVGTNDVIDLYWVYTEDLSDAGFTDYEILIMVNGQGFVNVFNGTVTGDSVYYVVNSSEYNNKDVIVVRMLLYSLVVNGTEGEFDTTWDDVTIFVLDPPAEYETTTTTTTTTRTASNPLPIDDGEGLLITILIGTGALFSIIVIGMMFGRRKRK